MSKRVIVNIRLSRTTLVATHVATLLAGVVAALYSTYAIRRANMPSAERRALDKSRELAFLKKRLLANAETEFVFDGEEYVESKMASNLDGSVKLYSPRNDGLDSWDKRIHIRNRFNLDDPDAAAEEYASVLGQMVWLEPIEIRTHKEHKAASVNFIKREEEASPVFSVIVYRTHKQGGLHMVQYEIRLDRKGITNDGDRLRAMFVQKMVECEFPIIMQPKR